MGHNTSYESLVAACPSRKYHHCFMSQLEGRYPTTQFRLPRIPSKCSELKGSASLLDPACTLPPAERVLNHVSGPRLHLCPPPPSPPPPPSEGSRVRCSSAASKVNAVAVLLLGVPSSPSIKGRQRRDAIRASWMHDDVVGHRAVVCFLLSSRTPTDALSPMLAEQAEHGDMLFLDAPETPWLIRQPTKYSKGRRLGRGMPTFKQYAFFQYAAAVHAPVPFVGKIDDDTAPNLRVLVPFLERLRCMDREPLAFVGAINFAAFVPRATQFGVRGDRCGFGWTLQAALANFGSSFGTRGQPDYVEACDLRGAVLPFPYGTGAGPVESSAQLSSLT